MKRFTYDEIMNCSKEEFAENWSAIACSSYELLMGEGSLNIEWDKEDEPTSKDEA